jgi:preprotein translocase subunit SecG
MIYAIFIVVHILIAALLVTVVLMQTGRGGGLAGAFGGGGGGGQSLFGGRGATTFLTKTTWVLGVAFMVTSFVLALAVSRRVVSGPSDDSEVDELLREQPAGSVPLDQPSGAESPGFEIPSDGVPSGGEPGGESGGVPAVPPDAGGTPSGGDTPAESADEVPPSGGD